MMFKKVENLTENYFHPIFLIISQKSTNKKVPLVTFGQLKIISTKTWEN